MHFEPLPGTDFSTSADPAATAPLQVHGPGDLLQLVPYLLGFHPRDSFVVVGLRNARVVLTARSDLADMQLAARITQLVRALVRADAREVIAVVYADDPVSINPPALPHGSVVAGFGEEAERTGLCFSDALLLSGGRWWSYCCSDDSCCPARGQELDAGAPGVMAAAATVAGLVALPSRADVEALLEPVPVSAREELQPLLAHHENDAFDAAAEDRRPRRTRSLVRALFAAARRADAGELAISDDQIARFGVALSEDDIRDSVWLALDDARIDGRELWRLLGRRLPSPYDASPLFLLGWRAWRDGNGTLASIAAARAIESDPQYTPADLLLAALSEAVDPHRLPRIRPGRLRLPRTA